MGGCLVFVVLILATVIVTAFLQAIGVGDGVAGTIGIITFFGLLIWGIVWAVGDEKRKKEEKAAVEHEEKSKINDRHVEYGCPLDCRQFIYAGGYSGLTETNLLCVWCDSDYLNLLSDSYKIGKLQLPLSNIKYYTIKGDLRQETEFIGDTKGLTTGETIMAEGLFGTAAAINRNKQPLSKIKNIDERKTIINAVIDDKDCFIFFEKGDLYNYLLEQIPEKEQSFVSMQKS